MIIRADFFKKNTSYNESYGVRQYRRLFAALVVVTT